MEVGLDFEVDKIVNSIEEVATGIVYKTDIVLVSTDELRQVNRKNGWRFNWKKEYRNPDHHVYKLTKKNDNIIQGLISIEFKNVEQYIFMPLIESAPHNKNPGKKFLGVAPNLVAFICKMSFEMGFNGTVSFKAKTNLIDHYIKTLGAELIFSDGKMAIHEPSAKKLVHSYYKDFFNE